MRSPKGCNETLGGISLGRSLSLTRALSTKRDSYTPTPFVNETVNLAQEITSEDGRERFLF